MEPVWEVHGNRMGAGMGPAALSIAVESAEVGGLGRDRAVKIFGDHSRLQAIFPASAARCGSLGFSEKFLPRQPPIRLPESGRPPNRGA